MTNLSNHGMEKKTDFDLRDILIYLKEMEKIRVTSNIQIDSKTRKLHAKMIKKLDSVNKAVKEFKL